MYLQLALVLAIETLNPGLNRTQSGLYTQHLLTLSEKNDIDPWLVDAIIAHESRWIASVVSKEPNGTCSVGLGQINVRDCDPQKMAHLQEPLTNIRRTVEHLALIRDLCPKVWKKKKCVQGGWIGLYNPGNKTYAHDIQSLMRDHSARQD